jgi:3-carboxy-cis,cis-muconate cycloisomerase
MDRSPGAPGVIFSMLHRSFGDAEMEAAFSESATVEAWLRTEAALAQAQATCGELSSERADAIATACRLENVDLGALWTEMANVGYPILPLVRQIDERLPAAERGSLHYGATTQDIMDTGLALQLAATLDRLEVLTIALGDALASQAEAHAGTVMAGRTHGQQAVPTTFGAKLATFLWQADRLRADLATVRERCCLVSLHGAAGTSAGLGPRAREVRAEMARLLGLGVPDGPWHVARDGLADFGAVCARAAGICARLAREVIDLSRTEIRELSESEGHHRGASSTMPQKANPIDSEAIVGMAVSAGATAGALYRAMEAGHERSAGEWQVEWHVLPQVAVLAAGCLRITERVVREVQVFPDLMASNLALEQGRTLAEAYMFRLAPELGREDAHDLVYAAATASRSRGIDLVDALAEAAGRLEVKVPVVAIEAADWTGQAVDEATRAVAHWRDGSSSGASSRAGSPH